MPYQKYFHAEYDALTIVGRVTADTLYSCQLIYSFTQVFYPDEFVNSFIQVTFVTEYA